MTQLKVSPYFMTNCLQFQPLPLSNQLDFTVSPSWSKYFGYACNMWLVCTDSYFQNVPGTSFDILFLPLYANADCYSQF